MRDVSPRAPLYTPRMPKTGKPMSVRMTNCGPLGWVTDERGYRYQPIHPETGEPWPPMPDAAARRVAELAGYAHPPEACLINFYGPDAKMGLHQDRDEQDFDAPVVSLSLGDTCLFRIGGTKRSDPTHSVRLASGDAVVLGGDGAARISRRRPDHAGHIDAAAGGRPHQSHHAARHAAMMPHLPAPTRSFLPESPAMLGTVMTFLRSLLLITLLCCALGWRLHRRPMPSIPRAPASGWCRRPA